MCWQWFYLWNVIYDVMCIGIEGELVPKFVIKQGEICPGDKSGGEFVIE